MMPNPWYGRELAAARAEYLVKQGGRPRPRRRGRRRTASSGVRRSIGLALVAAGVRVMGPAGLGVRRGSVR
jgi:hypothetical protein